MGEDISNPDIIGLQVSSFLKKLVFFFHHKFWLFIMPIWNWSL